MLFIRRAFSYYHEGNEKNLDSVSNPYSKVASKGNLQKAKGLSVCCRIRANSEILSLPDSRRLIKTLNGKNSIKVRTLFFMIINLFLRLNNDCACFDYEFYSKYVNSYQISFFDAITAYLQNKMLYNL